MTVVIDTTVFIDALRGVDAARLLIRSAREAGAAHASEITRVEVLGGMREPERRETLALLDAMTWHPVDTEIATTAGELGRKWLPSHHTIDAADLAIAATAQLLGAELLTKNVKHFPMFPDLKAPY